MKHLFTSCLVLLITLVCSCSKKSEQTTDGNDSYTTDSRRNAYSTDTEQDEDDEEVDYPDGRYCARVEYYYDKTGTSSTYTLDIDIEDQELDRIHWPNGGWLDHSHFSSVDISDGTAQFQSYEGIDYRITVVGKDGECSLSYDAVGEDELIADFNRGEEQAEIRRQRAEEEDEDEEEERRKLFAEEEEQEEDQ